LNVVGSATSAIQNLSCSTTLRSIFVSTTSIALSTNMFSGYSALQQVNISTISNTTTLGDMFNGCSSLQNLSLSFLANANTTITSGLNNLSCLRTVFIAGGQLALPSTILSNCPALNSVNITNITSAVGSGSFVNDSSLNVLAIAIQSTPAMNAVATGQIAVQNAKNSIDSSTVAMAPLQAPVTDATNALRAYWNALQNLFVGGNSSALSATTVNYLSTQITTLLNASFSSSVIDQTISLRDQIQSYMMMLTIM